MSSLLAASDQHRSPQHCLSSSRELISCHRRTFCSAGSHLIYMTIHCVPNKASDPALTVSMCLITLTGDCRQGWFPANRPKEARKFRLLMSEWSLLTVSSTCLFTKSQEYTFGAKVHVISTAVTTCCIYLLATVLASALYRQTVLVYSWCWLARGRRS